MTIATENRRVNVTAAGLATFSYNFRILDDEDLLVYLTTAAGVATLQTLDVDYTVAGVGDAGGGTITFTSTPTATDTVQIILDPALTQETDYTAVGAFPAEAHETALDKLTNHNKRTRDLVERSLRLTDGDPDGSSGYNANSNRISSLATPTAGTDAVTKDYADALAGGVAGSVIATDSTEARTLADRWGEHPNVKDFGALGDGATDDTAAFQAAVTAITGTEGTIYIPEGDYPVDLYSLTYGSKMVRWLFHDAATTTNVDAPQCYVFPSGATFGSDYTVDLDPSGSDNLDVYRVVGENRATSAGSTLFAYHFDLIGHTSGEAVRGLIGTVTNASDGDGETKGIRIKSRDLNTSTGAQAIVAISADCEPTSATQSARVTEFVLTGTEDDVAYGSYYQATSSARWKGGIVFHQGDEYEDAVIQASMDSGSAAGARFLKLKDHPSATVIFEVTKDGYVRGPEVHGGDSLTNSVKIDESSISRTSATGDLTISAGSTSGVFDLEQSGGTRLSIAASGPVIPAGLSARFGSASGAGIFSGTGDPNGVVSAPQGSIFLRTDGTTNTTLWVRETGAATNWAAK